MKYQRVGNPPYFHCNKRRCHLTSGSPISKRILLTKKKRILSNICFQNPWPYYSFGPFCFHFSGEKKGEATGTKSEQQCPKDGFCYGGRMKSLAESGENWKRNHPSVWNVIYLLILMAGDRKQTENATRVRACPTPLIVSDVYLAFFFPFFLHSECSAVDVAPPLLLSLGGPALWQSLYIVFCKRPWEFTSPVDVLGRDRAHVWPVMTDSVHAASREGEDKINKIPSTHPTHTQKTSRLGTARARGVNFCGKIWFIKVEDLQ